MKMESVKNVISARTEERNKVFSDLQHLVMICSAWGAKEIAVDVSAAALMVKLSEKLLRTQVELTDAENQLCTIRNIVYPSVKGYAMREKSETTEAISLEVANKFISALSREQQKESLEQSQATNCDSQEKVGH
ncbi:hypothetical protein MFFDBJGM_02510 [Pectobacterium versatile]|nr:hypothetical protein MFFDBJGM_02510 [Pectobacterium versatile]GKV88172.1 hypothetical protein PEC301619_01540 [Pectobacterium carotovorum subsp. carotovorum]